MLIGMVVEGLTDQLVLQHIVNRLIPEKNRFLLFQPSNPPDRINGWKGVRDWCCEFGPVLEEILSNDTGDPLDMLLIHMDMDIAGEKDLQEKESPFFVDEVSRSCPPIRDTAVQLEKVIGSWLKREKMPDRIIFAIPSQDTENWTFSALFPDDELCGAQDYECIKKGNDRPAYKLSTQKYGKHLTSKGREVKKSRRKYQHLAPQIAENWSAVCRICSQARRLDESISAWKG